MGHGRARALSLACAVAAASTLLAGCTWDPQAPLRSSSSGASGGAGEPSTGPPASSVSNHVTPSGEPSPSVSTPRASASSPGSAAGSDAPDDLGPLVPERSGASGAVEPFDSTLPRATGAGTGEEVGTLADLTLTGEEGLDRVVIELEGPDVPAWEVEYVDRAVGDPSGEPVTVAGRATLQVLLHPVAYPEDGAAPYDGPARVTKAGTRAISEVVLSSIFEGELQVFVGVENWRRPFRVYGMTDPARIVIEVQRP